MSWRCEMYFVNGQHQNNRTLCVALDILASVVVSPVDGAVIRTCPYRSSSPHAIKLLFKCSTAKLNKDIVAAGLIPPKRKA